MTEERHDLKILSRSGGGEALLSNHHHHHHLYLYTVTNIRHYKKKIKINKYFHQVNGVVPLDGVAFSRLD